VGISCHLPAGNTGRFGLIIAICVCARVLGLSLTLSTLIEGKTFNQGGHKIGLGLDFEP